MRSEMGESEQKVLGRDELARVEKNHGHLHSPRVLILNDSLKSLQGAHGTQHTLIQP